MEAGKLLKRLFALLQKNKNKDKQWLGNHSKNGETRKDS